MESIHRVTAFTNVSSGGNPAGVVLNADKFSESKMLSIAKNIGFSETAFVMESKVADYKLRFFTPVAEVDLCGHATIATFNLLWDLNLISKGLYTQETKSGVLALKVEDTCVYMQQQAPVFTEIVSKDELLKCFEGCDIDLHYPIQIVSTGLKDIILPIRSLKTLKDMKLKVKETIELSKKYNVIGIHAFSLEDYDNSHIVVRNFAPLYGINEEAATGTANGALACYLHKYVDNNKSTDFVMKQGDFMNRASTIQVKLTTRKSVVVDVWVGGQAIRMI